MRCSGAGNAPPFLQLALITIGSCQSFSALLLPVPVPVSRNQRWPAALRNHFWLRGSMTSTSLLFAPLIHGIQLPSAARAGWGSSVHATELGGKKKVRARVTLFIYLFCKASHFSHFYFPCSSETPAHPATGTLLLDVTPQR